MNEQLLNIAQEWRGPLLLAAQVLAILLGAYLLQRLVARALTRLSNRYPLPPELLLPARGGIRWLIMGGALIMVLERFGVSAAVLWTAISGFVASCRCPTVCSSRRPCAVGAAAKSRSTPNFHTRNNIWNGSATRRFGSLS